jgi:hypothetical protein
MPACVSSSESQCSSLPKSHDDLRLVDSTISAHGVTRALVLVGESGRKRTQVLSMLTVGSASQRVLRNVASLQMVAVDYLSILISNVSAYAAGVWELFCKTAK